MSSLKLYGSTSGYVEIVPEATAGNNSVTLPSGSGTLVTQDGSGNITITGRASVPLGSASSPSIYFDDNTGIYSPGADQLAITTGGTARITIDSSGNINIDSGGVYYDAANNRLGLGTSSPGSALDVRGTNDSGGIAFRLTNASDAGTTTPFIDITAAQRSNNADGGRIRFGRDDVYSATTSTMDSYMAFYTSQNNSDTERLRIDSSGRLLVGTSSSRSNWFNTTGADPLVQIESSSPARLSINRNDYSDNAGELLLGNSRSSGYAGLLNNDSLGRISFQGADGSEMVAGAYIQGFVDGTPGANDMPGRLVFSTTADGAAGPTERMRISQNGLVTIPSVYSNTTANAANVHVDSGGTLIRSTSSGKYKTNIETLEDFYADAILDCRPVWYRSTCKSDNPKHGWWGFIAEEVAEIDPRLVHWKTVEVTYDEKGSAVETPCDPEPEGVAYDRFVPHLLNLIKRQGEAITELQAEVAALKNA